ncbi:MAG: hypothetical protein LBT43_18585 [Prevotella sp.]|jgi:hypothetical protein|nr:hypothetical protein [Prevotella sp.]
MYNKIYFYDKKNDSLDEKEAIKVLHYYQKWRRGAAIPMPNPTQAGKAIDIALKTLRKSVKQNKHNHGTKSE